MIAATTYNTMPRPPPTAIPTMRATTAIGPDDAIDVAFVGAHRLLLGLPAGRLRPQELIRRWFRRRSGPEVYKNLGNIVRCLFGPGHCLSAWHRPRGKRGFHFRVTRHDSINFVSDRSVVKRRRIPRDSAAVPIVSFEQLPEEKPPWPTCSMRRTRTVRLSLAAR